mmetsp:Transcript_3351/g.3828  ORF Transcript_3351/g.3828 Transcript_3351/m.3828 type:complete len:230 (-) Transcript_3351:323-1012(-)
MSLICVVHLLVESFLMQWIYPLTTAGLSRSILLNSHRCVRSKASSDPSAICKGGSSVRKKKRPAQPMNRTPQDPPMVGDKKTLALRMVDDKKDLLRFDIEDICGYIDNRGLEIIFHNLTQHPLVFLLFLLHCVLNDSRFYCYTIQPLVNAHWCRLAFEEWAIDIDIPEHEPNAESVNRVLDYTTDPPLLKKVHTVTPFSYLLRQKALHDIENSTLLFFFFLFCYFLEIW